MTNQEIRSWYLAGVSAIRPLNERYTLLVNGRQVGAFDDWPKNWNRAAQSRAAIPSKRQSGRSLSPASARS